MSRRVIPNGEPWLFVTTKKGNTFIHNPETKQSLWAAPEELKDVLTQMEKLPMEEERSLERNRRRTAALAKQQEEEHLMRMADTYDDSASDQGDALQDDASTRGVKRHVSATVEDEQMVEEDEYYDEDEYFDEEHDEKRLRTGEDAPVEFTEDDIAWQLGAMAEDYGLDDEDLEGNEDMPISDAAVVFKDLLDDFEINPYSTWESEMPKLIDDARYTGKRHASSK
jgi:hypothetical protein